MPFLIMQIQHAAPLLGDGFHYWFKPSIDWAVWIAVMLALLLMIFTGWIYWTERGRSRKTRRVLPFLIRSFLFTALVFAILDWDRHGVATRRPDLVLIIDDSTSAAHVDQFEDAQWSDATSKRLAQNELAAPGSRLTLAKLLLLDDDAKVLAALSRKYNVKIVRSGESVRALVGEGTQLQDEILAITAEQRESRIGDAINEICRSQSGSSTAAIVLMSDGIVTSGTALDDAAQVAANHAIPVFTIGIGVDRPAIDAALSQLKADDKVFVNDTVSFEFQLNASGLRNRTLHVGLFDGNDDRKLGGREIVIDSDSATVPLKLRHRVDTAAEHNFEIRVEASPGETNLKNNVLSKRVVVSDDSIQVLLIQDEPSYEYRFLKQLFDRQKRNLSQDAKLIQLTTFLQSAEFQFEQTDTTSRPEFPVDPATLNEFDVIIFADARPQWKGGRSISELELESLNDFVVEHGGSVVFLAGPNHMPSAYFDSPLIKLFPVTTEAQPATVPRQTNPFRLKPTRIGLEFPFFDFAGLNENDDSFSRLPYLRWNFPMGDLKRGVLVLAESVPVNGESTEPQPLATLHYAGAGAVIFLATDEFFRWRYRRGDEYYGHFWIQLIRMLSRSKTQGGQNVVIKTDRPEYLTSEAIHVEAVFRDTRLFEDLESVEIQLHNKSTNSENKIELLVDPSMTNIFRHSFSGLAAGSYEISVIEPSQVDHRATATFQVRQTVTEQEILQLDSRGLRKLSSESNGEYYSIVDALADPSSLLDRIPSGSTAEIQRLPTRSLWTWWPFVFLFAAVFVGAITAEWIVRKKLGMI